MACFFNIEKQNEKNKQILARQLTNPIVQPQQLLGHPLHSEYRICTETKTPETLPMPQTTYVDRILQDSQIKQLHKKLERSCPKETDITREVFTTTKCEFPNLPLPAHKLIGQNENLWNNATKRRYMDD